MCDEHLTEMPDDHDDDGDIDETENGDGCAKRSRNGRNKMVN